MHFLKEEKGLGMVETLIGIGLSVTLVGALIAVVYTAGRGVDRNNSKIMVFREIENAASFIGGDVAMAKYTDLVDGAAAVSSMTLEWTDYYGSTNVGHKSVYSLLEGEEDVENRLQRSYDGVVSTVAKGVDYVAFSRSGQVITVMFAMLAIEGQVQFSEERTYRFFMRTQ